MKKTKQKLMKNAPTVAIVMGSKNDGEVMNAAAKALEFFKIPCSVSVLSAHRTPHEVSSFAMSAQENGIKVIIAGAGGAAHLPGMVAAYTSLPVIGVPVMTGSLQGVDALLSIVQMPKGIPVATVAINNSWNAGVLAAQILSLNDPALSQSIIDYKESMRREVLG